MRSFIKEDISRALKLPVIGEETINLHTFGSDKSRQAKYKEVKAKLKNVINGQTVEVQILETPQVCTSKMSIAGEALRKELELKGLQLADTPVKGIENMELGVLIGGDHYWQMVTGRIERLRGVVAIESIFRWLIQGSVSLMNVVTEAPEVGMMKVITDNDCQLSD